MGLGSVKDTVTQNHQVQWTASLEGTMAGSYQIATDAKTQSICHTATPQAAKLAFESKGRIQLKLDTQNMKGCATCLHLVMSS